MNEWMNKPINNKDDSCLHSSRNCVCVCLRECNAMEWNEFKKKIKSNQMRMNEWMKDIKILKFQIKKKRKKSSSSMNTEYSFHCIVATTTTTKNLNCNKR